MMRKLCIRSVSALFDMRHWRQGSKTLHMLVWYQYHTYRSLEGAGNAAACLLPSTPCYTKNRRHHIYTKRRYCMQTCFQDFITSTVCCAMDNSSSVGMTSTFTDEPSAWISPGRPVCCLFLLSSTATPKVCKSHVWPCCTETHKI